MTTFACSDCGEPFHYLGRPRTGDECTHCRGEYFVETPTGPIDDGPAYEVWLEAA